MATFSEFVKDNQLEMKSTYIGASDDDTQFDWIVIIKFVGKGKNKQLKTDFHMGLAYCTFTPFPSNLEFNRRKGKASRTIHQMEIYGTVIPKPPAIENVLYCLQVDCMVENYADMWEFIDEFGYTGRDGERVYHACKSQTAKVKNFFGNLFNQFMELEED